jgi:threonyl-tRNA synthetase
MRDGIATGPSSVCRPVGREEALELFHDQPLKREQIEEVRDGDLCLYQHGDFIDLCHGPTVGDSAQSGAFRLLSVAGAYWRGNETNKMLQHVYGTVWPIEQELRDDLHQRTLAEEHDHRRLGKELKLFTFSPDIGSGLPLFLPKGEVLRHVMEEYMREVQVRHGYEHVWTGNLVKRDLYERSGHLAHYADVMFPPMVDENDVYMLKPMNCPSHMTLFNIEYHSYRDLPLRYAEFSTLYRYERSGELLGLARVRSITQDDAHIFCTLEEIKSEFGSAVEIIREVLNTYGFRDYSVQLSLRDPRDQEKFVEDEDKWARAEHELRAVLDGLGIPYAPAVGEAAFYGPKADFLAHDVLGREWQLSTIQIDFIQPEHLGSVYIGEDGQPPRGCLRNMSNTRDAPSRAGALPYLVWIHGL